jgi:quinol monooxygenase YgiN
VKENDVTAAIVSTTRISVQPGKRKELFLTITSLLDKIRSEEGCRMYMFYGETGDKDSFMLMGEWETRSAFTQHLNSEHFAILLGSLGMLSNRANLDFKVLSQVGGIEEIHQAGIQF